MKFQPPPTDQDMRSHRPLPQRRVLTAVGRTASRLPARPGMSIFRQSARLHGETRRHQYEATVDVVRRQACHVASSAHSTWEGDDMINCYAFRSVPPFAQGLVRDLRVRWALEEAGLPYRVTLVGDRADAIPPPDYRAIQP